MTTVVKTDEWFVVRAIARFEPAADSEMALAKNEEVVARYYSEHGSWMKAARLGDGGNVVDSGLIPASFVRLLNKTTCPFPEGEEAYELALAEAQGYIITDDDDDVDDDGDGEYYDDDDDGEGEEWYGYGDDVDDDDDDDDDVPEAPTLPPAFAARVESSGSDGTGGHPSGSLLALPGVGEGRSEAGRARANSIKPPRPARNLMVVGSPPVSGGMGPETPPATSTASVNADWKPVRDRDTVVYNSDDEEQLSQMLEAGGYPGVGSALERLPAARRRTASKSLRLPSGLDKARERRQKRMSRYRPLSQRATPVLVIPTDKPRLKRRGPKMPDDSDRSFARKSVLQRAGFQAAPLVGTMTTPVPRGNRGAGERAAGGTPGQAPLVVEVTGRPKRVSGKRRRRRTRDPNEDSPDVVDVQTPEIMAVRNTWVPSARATECRICAKAFSRMRQKHHCRKCGDVFCGTCSSGRETLRAYGYNRPVRVCDNCYATGDDAPATATS